MKRLWVIIVLLFAFKVSAQDVHFSQIYNTPLLMNPALTGSFNGELRASFNWKDQWRSIDKSFQTYALSFDHSLFRRHWKNAYIAYGVYLYRDVAGSVKYGTTQALASIAPTIKISTHSTLTAGVQFGWGNQSVDPSQFRWGNQYDGLNYDPTIATTESIAFTPKNYGDLGAGISYWYQRPESEDYINDVFELKAGVAVHHINRPSVSFYTLDSEKMPMRWTFHINSYFGIKNTNWGLWPQASYSNQGIHDELMLGMLTRVLIQSSSKKTGFIKEIALSVGAHARISKPFDAIIPQIFFEYTDFALGMSYDINISKLRGASQLRGGFELSLRYTMPDKFYFLKPTKWVPSL